MTVVMDPTKPYTSDGLGPWSRAAAKEGALDELSQSRWGRRFRIRLTVCLGLRTTSDGGEVGGGGHSVVFLAPSSISAADSEADGARGGIGIGCSSWANRPSCRRKPISEEYAWA
jgi:hypothetical protein